MKFRHNVTDSAHFLHIASCFFYSIYFGYQWGELEIWKEYKYIHFRKVDWFLCNSRMLDIVFEDYRKEMIFSVLNHLVTEVSHHHIY